VLPCCFRSLSLSLSYHTIYSFVLSLENPLLQKVKHKKNTKHKNNHETQNIKRTTRHTQNTQHAIHKTHRLTDRVADPTEDFDLPTSTYRLQLTDLPADRLTDTLTMSMSMTSNHRIVLHKHTLQSCVLYDTIYGFHMDIFS